MTEPIESEELTAEQFRNSPEGKETVEGTFVIEGDETETEQPVAEGTSPAKEATTDEPSKEEAVVTPEKETALSPEERGLAAELEKTRTRKEELKQALIEERAAMRALKAVKKLNDAETQPPAAVTPPDPNAPVTQADLYNNTANLMTSEFLKDHPEFTPDNDPLDENWSALLAEYNKYAKPTNPYQVKEVLGWAFTDLQRKKVALSPKPNPTALAAAKKNLATAGQGSGGSAAAPVKTSTGTLNKEKYDILIRGNWSEEEARELATE